MKGVFRLACFLMAVILAFLMFIGWTEPGLRLLVNSVNRLSGGTVSCGSVRGALLTSFALEDLSLATPGVQMRFGRIGSSWQLPELFNKRLHLASLTASDVDIQLSASKKSSGSVGEIKMPKLAVPLLLILDNLTVDRVRLLSAKASVLTRIDHLSLGLAGSGGRFTLTHFSLTAPGYGGNLTGLLDTGKDWYIELAGAVEYKDYGTGPFAGVVSLKGPLANLDTVVDVHRPARGHVEGRIMDLPNRFRWNANLALYDVQLADGHRVLPEMKFTVSGTAKGERFSYGGKLKGKLDYLFFKDVDCEIEVAGDQHQIAFPEVTAVNARGKAHLTDGLLSWTGGLGWHGKLAVEKVDPSMMLVEYPGAINAELSSSGHYRKATGLEMQADFPKFSGELRGYQLAGHGRLQVDRQVAAVEDVLVQSGKSVLRLNGRIEGRKGLTHWRESLNWKAGLQLAEFDPALFFPDYPGKVNTQVRSAGEIGAKGPVGRAEIVALDGVLRGYPLSGKGAVRLAGKDVHMDDLLLRSGRSSLTVSGAAGEKLDVAVRLSSENIGEFLEGAGGGLKLAGTVKGASRSPRVEATMEAKRLSYETARVDSLQIRLEGGLNRESALTAKVDGAGLHLGSQSADKVTFDLAGKAGKHDFSADLKLAQGAISLSGDGALHDDYSWAGKIRKTHIAHPLTGTWRQEGVAAVAFDGREAQLSSFCLGSDAENICLSGGWLAEKRGWQADMDWKELDLARLNNLLTLPEPVRGLSTGSLTAAGDLAEVSTAKGLVKVEKAGFGKVGDQTEWQALQLDRAELKLNLRKNALTSGLTADFADGSTLAVTTEIPGFGRFAADPARLQLRGNILADLRNLAFIAPLTNYYLQPSGALRGNLALSGTVGGPVASGRLALADGQIDLPVLGITLRDVQAELTGRGETLDILATGSSGPGRMQAKGSLLLASTGVAGNFHLDGNNFDIARLPEYEVRISPDLEFVFNHDGGRLTGQVDVPHAVIAPERMAGSLKVSDDVVYLDGEVEEKADRWPFSTTLQINLGDDVRLDGYGITGYLRGDLQVEKTPGTDMQGTGQLSLADGIFSIYGRTLSIERSRVMFTGGPIDNPGVDVVAKKIVADNKRVNETIEVGVEVSGTADNLEYTLFSDPPMEESDILAYMVVGRAMSDVGQQDESLLNSAAMALGLDKKMGGLGELTGLLPVDEMYIEGEKADEMSLVVGKHLTRKLFIGYGHNFFDQEGEVRLRYNLGSGFSAETRSSGDATGADLLYSFER